jgi:hypothetical protein
MTAFNLSRLYLNSEFRCASWQRADKDLTHLAMPGDLAVAPLAPLGISQEQRHGFALRGVGPRQAVAGKSCRVSVAMNTFGTRRGLGKTSWSIWRLNGSKVHVQPSLCRPTWISTGPSGPSEGGASTWTTAQA